MTPNNNSGGWCFSASVARDYGLKAMMKWTRHKLCRQGGVPSHCLQTKLDTSAQWCSTTSHNIIMTERRLRGCTEFSPPLIFLQSMHLLGRVQPGRGQGSPPSPRSECATAVFVWACVWIQAWLSVGQLSPVTLLSKSIQREGLWRQLRANYSTGHNTDEFCRRERWLSVCVKSVCACVRERDVRAECHTDICQGPVCIWSCVCVSMNVHKVSETTPRVTLQLCHMMNTQRKVSSSLQL